MRTRRSPPDEVGQGGHQTVLLGPAVDALAIRPDGVYVDGTFGRGGHSRAILAELGEKGRLVAIDRDPEAVAYGCAWADGLADARVSVHHARFAELADLLDALSLPQVDGVLLDLGVSSPQLDDPARGFSFREDGPLDMRMDPTRGESARDWLLRASEQAIAEVLRDYGDERHASQIAKAVVARRGAAGEAAFATTGEFARLVAGVLARYQRRPEVGKNPATRAFQAARIFINQELAELEGVLTQAVARLRAGGRLAVISFHSIEDRIVKQFIRAESGVDAPRDPVTGARVPDKPARLKPIARVLPGAVEVASNPRARSAVLRVAERSVA